MKSLIPVLIFASLFAVSCDNVKFASDAERDNCRIGEFSKEEVKRIKQAEFKDITNEELNKYALDLLSCVGSPDPEMRDGIVYESLSYLLRQKRIDDKTKVQLTRELTTVLQSEDDRGGYLKPFAALDLSELARADRIDPYLSDLQRAELATAAADYLTNLTDYRGYDEREGWRHGVAHTADLILQLSLNEKIIEPQLRAMRVAVASQIAPDNHAYIHGESERLARPILYMARRGIFTQEDWDGWFAKLADPAPFEAWSDVFTSEKGLAKLHNTKAFLNSIHLNASVTENTNIKTLEGSALNVLKKLP